MKSTVQTLGRNIAMLLATHNNGDNEGSVTLCEWDERGEVGVVVS